MPIFPWSRPPRAKRGADDTTWFHAVGWAMGIGLAGIGIYSWAQRSWTVFSLALLIGLAASLVGALTGFLFGVPKTVATGGAGAAAGSDYQSNTNLEQISDWLTKTLVGTGLVEMKDLVGALNSFSDRFRGDHSMGSFGWVVAPAVAIANAICGFLLTYLWARIYMIQDLKDQRGEQAAASAPPNAAGHGADSPVSA